MKTIRLYKLAFVTDEAHKLPRVIGKITIDGSDLGLSFLMKSDKKNLKRVSGIKDGQYKACLKNAANNIPYQHIALSVPNRESIKIYSGSKCTELDGNILVGKTLTFDRVYQMYDLTDTKQSLDLLLQELSDEDFNVIVETSSTFETISASDAIFFEEFSGKHNFLFDQLEIPSYGEFYL